MGAVGVISAEMTTTTKGFVTAAATSDMYEVEAGKTTGFKVRDADGKLDTVSLRHAAGAPSDSKLGT